MNEELTYEESLDITEHWLDILAKFGPDSIQVKQVEPNKWTVRVKGVKNES